MPHCRTHPSLRGYGRKSFTLIELLIVIAIVAVLSIVVVLVLNPAELLKQSRDTNRLSDLDTLNHTLNLYRADVSGGSLGTASTTYLSLIDPAATSTTGTNCAGLGLTAPTSWTYHCAASSTQKNIDGTGWLPVNFKSISYGTPLGVLPTDPTNTNSTGLYYMYTPSAAGWALATMTESAKYLTQSSNDGGYDPSRYETGSTLSLVALSEGLTGWWPLNEGAGSAAADTSGNGNTGTIAGGVTFGQPGKIGNAMLFDGSSGVITMPVSFTAPFSISMWVKPVGTGTLLATNTNYRIWRDPYAGGSLFANDLSSSYFGDPLPGGSWTHVVITFTGVVGTGPEMRAYYNGALYDSSQGHSVTIVPATAITIANGPSGWFSGTIDDVRIYSRALSAADILAFYNATR